MSRNDASRELARKTFMWQQLNLYAFKGKKLIHFTAGESARDLYWSMEQWPKSTSVRNPTRKSGLMLHLYLCPSNKFIFFRGLYIEGGGEGGCGRPGRQSPWGSKMNIKWKLQIFCAQQIVYYWAKLIKLHECEFCDDHYFRYRRPLLLLASGTKKT